MGFLRKYAELIYFIALLIIAAGMPLGNFIMSIGGILLLVSWLFHGNLIYKIQHAFSNRIVIFLALFYFLHLIGFIYSEDMSAAFNDARVKVPLLLFPMIIFTMPRPEEKKIKILLSFLVFSVLISSIISYLVHQGWISAKKSLADPRNISMFISHIRLSLLVCVSISILTYFAWKNRSKRIPAILIIFWFIYFLYLLVSATGFIILFTLILFALICVVFQKVNMRIRISAIVLALLLIVIPSIHIHKRFHLFFTPTEDIGNLDIHTAGNEPYIHETHSLVIESGKFINIYIAPAELAEAWKKRSDFPYEKWDEQNQLIRHTLVRYMSSKGLRKDRQGVESLTDEDIRNVEKGITNINYLTSNNFDKRLDQLFFEIEIYLKGMSPVGGSVIQRLEFWKNGWMIFKEHRWFGVGTGDAQLEYNKMYERNKSLLDKTHRLRSHNQFLAVMIGFGLIGLVLFITSLILPLLKAIRKKNLLYISFFICASLSFLTEDTLETQAGATFFAFLNSVLLFLIPDGFLDPKKESVQ